MRSWPPGWKRIWLGIGCVVLLIFSGCAGGLSSSAQQKLDYEPFIAPTLVPTPLPTLTPLPTPEQTTLAPGSLEGESSNSQAIVSEAGCVDNLTFIADLTIPDGTVVVAGSTLDKQWEVENSGTCNWGEGYEIRLISGPDLGTNTEQALIPARSGSQVTIRLVLTAPSEAGSYHSAWQAYNPQGNSFGDPFYTDFVVE